VENEEYLVGYWNMDKENPKVVFSQDEKEKGMEMFIITFSPVPNLDKKDDLSIKNLKKISKDLKNLSEIGRRLIK
jgi:hypothetical protein